MTDIGQHAPDCDGLGHFCGLACMTDTEQHVDLELVAVWRKDKGCRAIGAQGAAFKYIHSESSLWESPREPYEVRQCSMVRSARECTIGAQLHACGSPGRQVMPRNTPQ
jgi:hypothetical protein